MRRKIILVAAVAVCSVAMFWNSTQAAKNDVERSEQTDAKIAGDGQAVLHTQQFENGEVHMKQVGSDRLESFLQDLNKRRDYDLSQHEGRPGPDNEYLTTWVKRTMDELLDRGYYVDKYGDLHRPGEIVPTR